MTRDARAAPPPTPERSGLPELPGAWPLVGHLPAFRRDPLGVLRRLSAQPGLLWPLRLGPRRVLVTSSPAAAEALLTRLAPALEKGPLVRRWSRPLLGEGLISCPTDLHAEHRLQLAPAAASFRREPFRLRLTAAAQAALDRFGALVAQGSAAGTAGSRTFDLEAVARALVAEVLAPALIAGEAGASPPILAAVEAVNQYLAARVRNPLLPPLGALTSAARRAGAALDELNAAVDRLIAGRRVGAPVDLLDHLLIVRQGDGSPLPRRRVRDELVTFLAAAHETTATALTWTLALLARHPGAAASVRDEARAVAGIDDDAAEDQTRIALVDDDPTEPDIVRADDGVPDPGGGSGATPIPDDDGGSLPREGARLVAVGPLAATGPRADPLPALVRCELAIAEAMRLWPPVHTLGRQTRVAVDLLGHHLPAGTIVAVSTFLLHRRPDLYPEPDRFLPERFAHPHGPGGRFGYLPFGGGPRACIGGEVAVSVLKLLVSGLLARYDLLVPPDAPLIPELLVTLRPRSPLPIRFVALS
jgi:cytochrome P450